MNRMNSIRYGNTSYKFASYRETTYCIPGTYCQCFPDRRISRKTRLTTTIVYESDSVHGRVPAAASLYFVLTAQVRKPSLSASLGWADGAQKRRARNSDGGAAIIEVLSHPLCFRSLRLFVVALGRSSWGQNNTFDWVINLEAHAVH